MVCCVADGNCLFPALRSPRIGTPSSVNAHPRLVAVGTVATAWWARFTQSRFGGTVLKTNAWATSVGVTFAATRKASAWGSYSTFISAGTLCGVVARFIDKTVAEVRLNAIAHPATLSAANTRKFAHATAITGRVNIIIVALVAVRISQTTTIFSTHAVFGAVLVIVTRTTIIAGTSTNARQVRNLRIYVGTS